MRRRRNLLVSCVLSVLLLAVPAAAADPAGVALSAKTLPDGSTQLTAAVKDNGGAPVDGATVTFRAKTAFGWLTLAEETTDQAGKAEVILGASSRYGEIVAEAGAESPIRASIRFEQGRSVEPAKRPGPGVLTRLSPQPGFISPYPVPLAVLFLTVILGGIWTTYGYLVSLLVKIHRAR